MGDLVFGYCKIKTIPDTVTLHEIIKTLGAHKFLGAQIQVEGQLDPDKWNKYLSDYWVVQLCKLLCYGFP